MVIGAGLIGREHCDLVRAHPGSELVAIADISKAGQQYAEEINTPYFSNYLEMLDEAGIIGASALIIFFKQCPKFFGSITRLYNISF